MTDMPIIAHPSSVPALRWLPETLEKPPDLHTAWQQREQLPACARECATLLRCLEWLAPLHWADLTERDLQRNWGQTTIPYHAFIAAELIRLNERLHSASNLHQFLQEHPGFIWLLGFPLQADPRTPVGFNALASLPTARHFTRMQRQMPNAVLQCVLADSVQLILSELAARGVTRIDCVSLDTKHILAWVKENNPKAYVSVKSLKVVAT